ncbi:glycine betaine ABC transporter substrate-binding protein [Marinilabiliaceae bacterium JC017]|nr:glycine betaine ABC transporter substrate-binding protein [Marinilabiliaceae bacterium JC017]
MIRYCLIHVITVVLLLTTGSCQFYSSEDEDQRTIRLVHTDWTESVALNYLSTILLEDKLGYTVISKLTDVASAYNELATGKADVFTDAWLPKTQQEYYDQYAGDLELVGITYPEARTGFVVPDYSTLKTVSDLNHYSHAIIGIDSGAGIMHKARLAMKWYELDLKLVNLSEEKMVHHLQDSIARRRDIVVTGWEPHWIFARYKVRFLKDPDGIFGEKENIYTISRKGLEEEHPNAVRFFERMQLSEKQLNNLVYEMRMSDDPVRGVMKWIKQNEYVVNQWVKDLQPERLKIM